MQTMTDPVQILRQFGDSPAQRFQLRNQMGFRRRRALHSFDLDFKQCQFLAQVVVNLPGDAPLLGFLRQQKVSRKSAQPHNFVVALNGCCSRCPGSRSHH